MSAKTPCIDVCKFDGKSGYCIGCLRTGEECKGWKKMKDKHGRRISDEKLDEKFDEKPDEKLDEKPRRAAMLRK